MGVKRPIGFGIGSFGVVDVMSGGSDRAAHNSLLEAFVELGALGLVLFLRIYWIGLSQLASVGRLPTTGHASAQEHRRSVFARRPMSRFRTPSYRHYAT